MATKKRVPGKKTAKKSASKGKSKPRRDAARETEHRLKTVLEQIGPDFVEQGARQIRPKDIAELVKDIDKARAPFEAGALERYRMGGTLMASLVEDYRNGDYTLAPYWTISVSAFALRYVLKPIDIIPDSLPVIGKLDDAVVVSHALAMIKTDLHAYKIWRVAREVDRE